MNLRDKGEKRMKKIVTFDEEEYDKIREQLVVFKDDIWDVTDPGDRSIMFEDLTKLEELLGIYD